MIAGVPVLLFLAGMALLWWLNIQAVYSAPLLLMTLNLFCATLTAAFLACLIGFRFLANGEIGHLLMGSGAMAWSAAGFVAALAPGGLRLEANTLVTIQTVGAWLASLCFLAGTALQLKMARPLQKRALWMAAAYTFVLGCVFGTSLMTQSEWLPLFFEAGSGNTFVCQLMLGMTILILLITASQQIRPASRGRPAVLAWYAMSLLLQATGLLGALLSPAQGSLLDWAGTLARHVGTLYMVGAAVATLRPSSGKGAAQESTPVRAQLRYGIAVVAACSAIALRLVFLTTLETRVTYLTFYPAVMLAALFGGFRTGLLTALLSAALADFFLIEPIGSIGGAHVADKIGIAVFLCSCAAISWLAEAMHRAQRKAAEALVKARNAAERADTAERLHSQQQFLSAVLQTVGSFVIVLDREGRVVHFNRAAEAATGYSLSEIRGFCFWNVLAPPEEREAVKQIFSKLCSGLFPSEAENTWVARDGTRHLCHWVNTCLTDRAGKVLHIIGTGIDITDRKRAENALVETHLALKQERDLLQAVMEGATNTHLAYLDSAFNFVRVNTAFAAGRGYQPEELAGKNFFHLYPDAELESTFSRVLETGEAHEAHDRPFAHPGQPQGAATYWDWTLTPIKDATAGISGLILSLYETTERRQTQSERDLTIAFLRIINASKNVSDLLRAAALFFKERAACDAVGIRLKVGNDFPYRESIGFPPSFLEKETFLCTCGQSQETRLTTCLCGQVLSGKLVLKGFSLTDHGSFWSNDTDALQDQPLDPQASLRGRCILDGYGSIALVPLHENRQLKGLLQLNVRRKNAFTPSAVSLWGRLADQLAIAVSKFQAEEALRQSRARFQLLAAATFEGIAITNEGRLVEANAQLARMLGHTRAELIGVEMESLFSPEDRDQVSQAFCSGAEATIEHRMVHKDGSLITVESHGKPWTIDGRHARLIAIRDITSRKRIEEALRTSEARFRNVFDHAATGIAVTDCAGRFVQCNAAYSALLGYSPDELGTISFPALIHPEDRPQNMALINQLLSGEVPSFETENRYIGKSGRIVWVHKYVSLMRDDEGNPSHIIALVTDTTQRKQTEDVLRFLSQCDTTASSENFFQHLARYLSQTLEMDFVCIDRLTDNMLSAHTIAVYHSGTFEDNVHYSLKDTPCGNVVGNRICCFAKNVQSLFPKDDVLRTLQAESYVGTTLWDSQGKPIGLIAVIGRTPLSDPRRAEAILQLVAVRASGELERQQTETALRESQADLNRAQGVAHVGSWRLNVQRNELLWSDESWHIFGVPPGTPLTYEIFLDTIHPDDRAYVHEKWSAAQLGAPYDIEHRIVVGDTVKWVRERAELEFDDSGNLLGGFGTTQDITDRKNAEAVKARYELIAQYARDPLLLLNLDGSIIEANQAAVQFYGYPREDLIGMRLYALRQDDAEVVDLQIEQALSGGVLFETNHVRKDGTVVPVEVSSRGVTISGTTMLLSVIRDISQRKENERNLRRAKDEAERASQAKSEFLAAMSHELRTPLNAVMGFSQVLEHEYFGPLTDKQREYVNDIYESGRHLLSLINDILDLSKIEAGKMVPLWTAIDISALLENSLVLVREKCAKHGIHLGFDLAASVRGLEVFADERRLKQVLYNLLSNATKFTPDGGDIRLQADLTDDPAPMLKVVISDSGIGISAEHQKHVFEAFYQVQQGLSNKTAGTGLGLCLVDQLVAMHGGRIWVESGGEGCGSRFTFVIPVDARSAVTDTAEVSQ